LFIREHIWLIF